MIRQNQCKDQFAIISKVIWQTKGSSWRNALLVAFQCRTQPLLQLTKGNAFQIICKKHMFLLLSNYDTLSNLHLWVFMCIHIHQHRKNARRSQNMLFICKEYDAHRDSPTNPLQNCKALVPANPQLVPSLLTRLRSLKSVSLLGKACWRTELLKKGLGQGGFSHTAWQLTVHDNNNRHTCKVLITFKFTCLAPQRCNGQGSQKGRQDTPLPRPLRRHWGNCLSASGLQQLLMPTKFRTPGFFL